MRGKKKEEIEYEHQVILLSMHLHLFPDAGYAPSQSISSNTVLAAAAGSEGLELAASIALARDPLAWP